MEQDGDVFDILHDCVKLYKKSSKKPKLREEICDQLKKSLKKSYDFTKTEEVKIINSQALPHLFVEDFDVEQIWQQVELQNDPLLNRSLTNVGKLLMTFKNLGKEIKGENRESNKINSKENETLVNNREKSESSESHDENLSESDDEKLSKSDDEESSGNEEIEDNELLANEHDEALTAEKENSDLPNSENLPNNDTEIKSKRPRDQLEDGFFNLEEMNQFLNAEEKKINDPDSGKHSDSESEDNVSLFDEDSEQDQDDARMAKYEDFFVAKDEKQQKNKILEELEENEEESEENEEEFEEYENEEQKSAFELRQERLKKKIEEIEEKAIQEKPWQLRGEIKAENRPQNSLLEEVLEFDSTTRPAPVMTEQTTLQLDDIIKQRIKEKVFDSVERKVKPVDTPLEYKKKLVLDQQKSKESLAQIYEKEYLKQKAALDPEEADKEPEEPELHKEIDRDMDTLFRKLDALSNYHFTPRPAIPELKIVSNLPAITMEEAAPVAVSDATLLAPEEIKNKPKADIMGKTERTSTDKNRERRKKKKRQQIHSQKIKMRESASKPGLGNKYSKEKTKKMLEKITKEKNVDKMDESVGSKSVKSSTAFFTQLQEEVQSQIRSKMASKKVKEKNAVSAKKIKM